MKSLLSTYGINIQEQRIRLSMRRVDPIGVAHRWARSIHRRVYRVSCPNALWHIDAYHALIRWKLIVHGGIDGFSRSIVFLSCSAIIIIQILYLVCLLKLVLIWAYHLV